MKSRGSACGAAVVVGLVGLWIVLGGCAAKAPKQDGATGQPAAQAPGAMPGPAPGSDTGPAPSKGYPKPAAPAAPGAAGVPGVQPSDREQAHFVHTVKYYGESVSIIAGWYTGDIKNWEALASANPEINPNRIVQGNRIRVPESLMIRKDAMTKEFVDSFYPKGAGKAKTPAPAPPEEEPALFGPKR